MPDPPSPAHLLRTDQHRWYFLRDPEGLRGAITEVGSSDERAGLASLVVTYGPPDAPVVQVGWMLRADDDDLARTDLARRLVFTVFAALDRHGADRGEIVRRVNAQPPSWTETVLLIDGREHRAWSAIAADARLAYAHVDDQTVFVQTSGGWDGSIALRGTLDRPRLPEA